MEQNDFVRTRLTHSIEVASIARSLGRSIASEITNKYDDKYGWRQEYANAIPVILEYAGLVHDIGNPPFGHSSEKAIQNWFFKHKKSLVNELDGVKIEGFSDGEVEEKISKSKRIQDFLNFDGNVQGFRILTHLQCICDYYGYHLTSALLATTMKYPVDSLSGNKNKAEDHKFKKFGYFDAEFENAEFVLRNCSLIDDKGEHYRSPLTIILEAADDIAYSAADIEDGFKKGLFSLNELLNILKNKESDVCIKQVINKTNEYINDNSILEERKIQWLRICIHQVYCDTVVEEFIQNYDKIMTGSFDKELLKDGKLKILRELLESFSFEKLINNQEVSKIEIAGKNVISFLLDEFSNDLITERLNNLSEDNISAKNCITKLKKSKTWNLISEDFKDIFIHTIQDKENAGNLSKSDVIYYTYLLITDFISGMTDNYCIRLYRRLNGIDIHN